MIEPGDCAICGTDRAELEPTIVLWKEPAGHGFEAVNRCVDRAACRQRVVDQGDVWPIVDPLAERPDNGKRDPNQPLTDWAGETRRVRAAEPPGMTDYRPPIEDAHGNFSFPKPIPIPAIPVVKPPIAPELDW